MRLADQRDSYPGPAVSTAAEVRAIWERTLVDRSVVVGQTLTLHDSGLTFPARVDWGRWLVDCPCGDAALAWPANTVAACLGCGAVHHVTFPDGATVAAAEEVLLDRRPHNRNWQPDRETVGDLRAESLLMGGMPDGFGGVVVPTIEAPADVAATEVTTLDRLLLARHAAALSRGI